MMQIRDLTRYKKAGPVLRDCIYHQEKKKGIEMTENGQYNRAYKVQAGKHRVR